MSLWNKVFKSIDNPLAKIGSNSGDRKNGREKRRFDRFAPHQPDLISARFANDTRTLVSNISYGGFACSNSPGFPEFEANQSLWIELDILGLKERCEVAHVQTRAGISAFSFIHSQNATTLLFLRKSLEPMRQGTTLTRIPGSLMKEKYAGEDWVYLRGEGPTDLMFRGGADGTIAQALMTFRRDSEYCEIRYEHGRITTGAAIDQTGIAASRMASHLEVDRATMHHAAAILLCTVHRESQNLIAQLLREVVKTGVAAHMSSAPKVS